MHPDLEEAIAFHECDRRGRRQGARSVTRRRRHSPTSCCCRRFRRPTTRTSSARSTPATCCCAACLASARRSSASSSRRSATPNSRGIQGRADLQPTEVVGFQMINPATGALVTEFGPLASAEVILLDEINRIPLKSQSAFLEGLQDRTVTVGKTTYELPAFSFAIATMNPVELGQGTFPLSEAATDRFAIMVNIGYLPPEEEQAGQLRLQARPAEPADAEGADHPAARGDQPAKCSCTSGWAIYIQRLVAASRPYNPDTDWLTHSPSELVEHSVDLGASPRAIICWGRLAKVWALLVRRRDRGLPGGHPGPRAVRSRPPHLARAARGQPRPDRRRGD